VLKVYICADAKFSIISELSKEEGGSHGGYDAGHRQLTIGTLGTLGTLGKPSRRIGTAERNNNTKTTASSIS